MSDRDQMVLVPAGMTIDDIKRQRILEASIEAATRPLDVAPQEGGVYIVDGVKVNANGEPIKEKPALEEFRAPSLATPPPPPFDEGEFAEKSMAELREMAEERDIKPGTSRASAIAAIRAYDDLKAQEKNQDPLLTRTQDTPPAGDED